MYCITRTIHICIKAAVSKSYSSIPHKSFQVGDKITVQRKITSKDIRLFAEVTGDTNPIHLENSAGPAVAHGAFLNGLVSAVIGTQLPGAGTLVLSQNLNFPNKCHVGDVVMITVELVEARKISVVKFLCETESGTVVMHGDARLLVRK